MDPTTQTEVTPATAPLTVSEAARLLSSRRHKESEQPTQPEQPDASAVEATPELTAPADAPPQPEAQGETETVEPAEDLPALEPPRSWTKEAKDRWQSLPRETQEYIAQREQERDREVRRSQNEAAETRKAAEAERAQVAQARQHYEAALPLLFAQLQHARAGEFPDIHTMADVQRLAREDPARFTQWQAHTMQINGAYQEVQAAQQRQLAENQAALGNFVRREAERFHDAAPEMKDEGQRKKLWDSAEGLMRDLNFTDDELGQLLRGEANLSVHDHRFQLLMRDAVKYREAKAQAAKVQAKPKPSAQRPGVAPDKSQVHDAEIKSLEQQLTKASGDKAVRIAAQLHSARIGRR